MRNVTIGNAEVSRVTVGGNQISGFSHQVDERSREMLSWFTVDRVCEFLAHAEQNGVNTVFARSDDHVIGLLTEYWRRRPVLPHSTAMADWPTSGTRVARAIVAEHPTGLRGFDPLLPIQLAHQPPPFGFRQCRVAWE